MVNKYSNRIASLKQFIESHDGEITHMQYDKWFKNYCENNPEFIPASRDDPLALFMNIPGSRQDGIMFAGYMINEGILDQRSGDDVIYFSVAA